ncbi:MAG: 30S ribosomal protein THX [Chitinophagales bacterium]|nr:30S ribosomal protein THX [Chitinophagales bacterium]
MGKGDIRTRKGKIKAGSYGKSRPRAVTPSYVQTTVKAEAKQKTKKTTLKLEEADVLIAESLDTAQNTNSETIAKPTAKKTKTTAKKTKTTAKKDDNEEK